MSDSNLPDNQYAFLWKFFSLHRTWGKLLFLLLLLLGLIYYLEIFNKESDCKGRVTVVGVLLNDKNRIPLEGVIAHFATFAKDETDSHGLFSVEGIEIPESKIITLRVGLQGGKLIEVEGIDLRNSVKYPVKDCKIDLGQILVSLENTSNEINHNSATGHISSDKDINNGLKTSLSLPVSSTLFNEESPKQIAILTAGKLNGFPAANLKNDIVERWSDEGFSTSTSLFQPEFYSKFIRNIENEDLYTLKSLGLGNRTACLCYLKIENIKPDKDVLETVGEEHHFEKVSGTLNVKFFSLQTEKVTSFSISETGSGGNQGLAMESLNNKFITQFFNHKLSLNLCKN